MLYAVSYSDYVLPAGYVEFPEVFNRTGEILYKGDWTGNEAALPAIDGDLKRLLQTQTGEELFNSLMADFQQKKRAVEQSKHAIITTKKQVDRHDQSILSFLHDDNLKKERDYHFNVATASHTKACQLYQAWVEILFVQTKGRISLNSEGIYSYLRKFIVEDYLRKILHTSIETYLFNPMTGESEIIPPHTWLGQEYQLSFSTGEVFEDSKLLGIILIPEQAIDERYAELSGEKVDKEISGLTDAIKYAVTLHSKNKLTKDEENTLLNTIALKCLEDYYQQYKEFPKKNALSNIVFNIVQRKYSHHFPLLNETETIKRRLGLEALKEQFIVQQSKV